MVGVCLDCLHEQAYASTILYPIYTEKNNNNFDKCMYNNAVAFLDYVRPELTERPLETDPTAVEIVGICFADRGPTLAMRPDAEYPRARGDDLGMFASSPNWRVRHSQFPLQG